MRGLDKIASCELSFIPVQSDNYKRDVKKVIEIISGAGIDYEVSAFSTTFSAQAETVFRILGDIYTGMDGEVKFTMVVKLSNVCGCGS